MMHDDQAPEPAAPGHLPIPSEFTELSEFRAVTLDRKLGYFGQQRFVIVGYSDRGQEVFWKDGLSSGFGLGHWQFFMDALVPAADRQGIDLGDVDRPGTHVIVLDRQEKAVYATCRNCAETYLSACYGTPPPARTCMCAASRLEDHGTA
jgi:hypothetical protein